MAAQREDVDLGAFASCKACILLDGSGSNGDHMPTYHLFATSYNVGT